MPLKCPIKRKEAHKKYMREVWYPNNKKKHIEYVKKLKQEHLFWMRSLKIGMACECGENHPACLDWHHIDPKQKKFSISNGRNLNQTKEAILSEIKKCKIICSNCHRKEHYKESFLIDNNLLQEQAEGR